jgi:hypothetical protein
LIDLLRKTASADAIAIPVVNDAGSRPQLIVVAERITATVANRAFGMEIATLHA